MRLKISVIPALAAAVAGVLMVACGAVASPAPTSAPPQQSPTATPVSPEARQTAVEFARSYQKISQDWDQFHRDFNQWRAGLVSCDRTSVEASLRDFAGEFSEVLRQARSLPRASITRDLADQMIKAAEAQGEALRQLRDGWQPANTALFNAVEERRSAGATAQQEVLDRLRDLRETTDPGSVEESKKFSDAFEKVSQDWKQLDDKYTALRNQQGDLSPADISSRLSDLVDEFSSVVSAIGDLPSSDATKSMSDNLTNAAEKQDQALKELRDTFQSQAQEGEGGESANGSGSSSSNGDDPFANLNSLVEESDNVRERVQKDLKNILEDSSAQKLTNIDNFQQQYDALVQKWNAFNQSYDDWRRSEGGCDRTEVINMLGQFSLRFGEIAADVRNLPRSSFVRPMADTVGDAAQREEEALRVLRNTWRPFATDAYRALDQERSNGNTLRRQAAVGIQELLERFSIPASEI